MKRIARRVFLGGIAGLIGGLVTISAQAAPTKKPPPKTGAYSDSYTDTY